MSITRLQQARQMYAIGKRVAKAFGGVMGSDGRRQYGGGSDMGASGGYGYQGGGTNKAGTKGTGPGSTGNPFGGGGDGNSGGYKSEKNPTGTLTGADYERARREFEIGVGGGLAKNQVVGPYGPYKPGYNYQPFLDYRPEFKPLPPLGPFGLLTNVLNKPFQKLSDFGSKKNRDYFINEVVRAGKIPGLNFGTIAEMTPDELEASYKSYLSDRSSGQIDAYGNPIGDNVGGNNNQGIATLYNYDMFDDTETETENTNIPFASRFLQNQPSDVRENIETRMQNYYTV